jgi:hypothetical protein
MIIYSESQISILILRMALDLVGGHDLPADTTPPCPATGQEEVKSGA